MIRCGEPQIGQREREYAERVLASGRLTEGPWVDLLAKRLAATIGRPATPMSSGTAALHVALLACGIGPGDEVIVPATTYVATANAVLMAGATPVVADVSLSTWTLSPESVRECLTAATRAVLPVHLYGVPADIGAIDDVLDGHYRRTGRRIYVVEDCAEALGAATPQGRVGTLGDAAAFSFYASKTITTGGEGGAVAWADHRIGDRAEHVSHQSMTTRRYVHDCLGWNYRMTELQAAVGVAQLERLDEFLDKRRQLFDWYDQRLPNGMARQQCGDRMTHGYWAYAALVGRSAGLVAAALADVGVESRPVFPPLGTFPHIGRRNGTPIAAGIHRNGLVLPTHCGMTERDVERVCDALRAA